MAANRGLIANSAFAGNRVCGTYFFAGDWCNELPDGTIPKFYEYPVPANVGLYTVHPSDARHLGWSETVDDRNFALDCMVHSGVNTVVMSFWGERGCDRWVWSAPMQVSTYAHDELFEAAVGRPLLIMPAIESANETFTNTWPMQGHSQSYNFSEDFPGTPANPAPALVTQVLDLINRYLQNPVNPAWPDKWLQMFDRDGVPRYAIYLLHVASTQIASDADEVFAAGFDSVADLVFAKTGIRVGFTLDALPTRGTYPSLINDRGGWVPWFEIPGQPVPYPGAPVTALWSTKTHLDLFTVSGDGSVITTYWDGNYLGTWDRIYPEMIFERPASVTALWKNDDHLDLFAVNTDGLCASIWWEGGYRTDGWFVIDPNTHFKPGTPITAVWANEGHLDLFAVGADGFIRTTWWDKDEANGYRADGWIVLPANGQSVPGGHVAALWAPGDDAEHLDLFFVTTDNTVSSIWWERGNGYRAEGWFAFNAERDFVPGAKVTAQWAPGADVQHLDLFTTDSNGIVKSIWWDSDPGGYRPEGWFAIPGVGTFPAGAPINMAWYAEPLLDIGLRVVIAACDANGAVQASTWTKVDDWMPWFVVPQPFTGVPGSEIATIVAPSPDHLDLFATDPNGGVSTAYFRFTPYDTYVAQPSSAGPWLEKAGSVLAIQGYIPEIYTDSHDASDKLMAKITYWDSWQQTGVPVFWDVSPGYDASVVFPGAGHWGNDEDWRVNINESWRDNFFCGVIFNTWNGYTEGYVAMPTLEYGDITNWVLSLFLRVK